MKTKMKTTSPRLFFPLLLFLVAHASDPAQGFKLECPQGKAEVQVGKNVTLNCMSETEQDLTKEKIRWKFNSTIFLDFIDGRRTLYKQFKGRVHPVSDWKVSEGKLSVEISSINQSDAGIYTCSVLRMSNCNVTLIVKKTPPNDSFTENPAGAQGDNTTTTSCGLSTGAIIGAFFGGVLVGVIGALVTWLIYRKRRRQRGGERDERGPPQVNQEDVPLQAENQPPAI